MYLLIFKALVGFALVDSKTYSCLLSLIVLLFGSHGCQGHKAFLIIDRSSQVCLWYKGYLIQTFSALGWPPSLLAGIV